MEQASEERQGAKNALGAKLEAEEFEDNATSETSLENDARYTSYDKRDMRRMGKRQELMRNFRLFSSIALTSCVMGTWEILLVTNTPGLIAGGLPGLFWSMVWGAVGQGFIVLSLAEMSSMAPTAGGQYHWVSEFAPPKYQKLLSYTAGWLSALGWQAFSATDAFILGSLIQSLILLDNPSYNPKRWQATLLIIAISIGMTAFNIVFAKHLALAENIFAVLHFGAFIPIIVVMLATVPSYNSAADVFINFTDNGAGWPSMGLTVLVGQVSALFTMLGSDSIAHMAEEVSDAGIVVPMSMFWSYVINIPLALGILVAFLFCIGDLEKAIKSGSPLIYAFQNATRSTGGATALTVVMFILLTIISISLYATTSRQIFAFSRDLGLPGSRWLSRVSPTRHVPVNSIVTTCVITCLLALINIGSTVAFNAVLSLGVVAVMATYMVSIGCILAKRLRGETLPRARWSLGRAGLPVNILALAYAIYAFFWAFWPNSYEPDASAFNWACVLFSGVMILACLQYFIHARKVYEGPVVKVRDE